MFYRPADPDCFRQLAVRWIAQKQTMRARNDGRVRFANSELLERYCDQRITFEIKPREKHAVLRQKISDAECVLRITRTDYPQSRELTRLAHQLPASDECLQADIAQPRVLIQNLPQGLLGNLVGFAIRLRNRAHHFRIAG